MLEVKVEKCAGIDVGKKFLAVCRRLSIELCLKGGSSSLLKAICCCLLTRGALARPLF